MLAYVTAALQLAPLLIQAGAEIMTLANQVISVVQSSGEPTQADWDALTEIEKPLRDQLQSVPTDGA